jgi:hypothetical protein
MTMRLDDVVAAGLALHPDESEVAALQLLNARENTAAEQAEVDTAWQSAITHRLNGLESGRHLPVSGRDTTAIAEAMIRNWSE